MAIVFRGQWLIMVNITKELLRFRIILILTFLVLHFSISEPSPLQRGHGSLSFPSSVGAVHNLFLSLSPPPQDRLHLPHWPQDDQLAYLERKIYYHWLTLFLLFSFVIELYRSKSKNHCRALIYKWNSQYIPRSKLKLPWNEDLICING